MAYRKVDEASLTAVADSIREKGGTTGALAFPDGFVSAVHAIQAGGGYSVSPNRPEGEYETRVRLIADEGKALTDGKVVTQCTDAESADGWTEIDAPGEDAPEVIAAVDEAIKILKGEERG